MTNQEAFTRVKEHLLKQGERCTSDFDYVDTGINSACKYRHQKVDGKMLKCAIGALIPDELYDPDIEGSNVASLRMYGPLIETFKGLNVSLLFQLQMTHDKDDPEDWPRQLQLIAKDWNLDY